MSDLQTVIPLSKNRGRPYDEIEVMAVKPIHYKRNRKPSDVFQMRRAFADMFYLKGLIEYVDPSDVAAALDAATKKKPKKGKTKEPKKDRMIRPKDTLKTAPHYAST